MYFSKKALVLYSGGRDSSSAAVQMAQAGYLVKLFTYQAGLSELVGMNRFRYAKNILQVNAPLIHKL